jgi:Uma2 family endonuclease
MNQSLERGCKLGSGWAAILNLEIRMAPVLCSVCLCLRQAVAKSRDWFLKIKPTLPISGKRNGDLSGQVWYWNRQTGLGEAFDSSTGYDFTAFGGGQPSPDCSWIEKSRLEGISLEKFFSIAPDFVIELRSSSDNLKPIQEKMIVYQRVGVRLGLLINPKNKQVEIYRSGQEVEILEFPMSIDCSDVMPGFGLDLSRIW